MSSIVLILCRSGFLKDDPIISVIFLSTSKSLLGRKRAISAPKSAAVANPLNSAHCSDGGGVAALNRAGYVDGRISRRL